MQRKQNWNILLLYCTILDLSIQATFSSCKFIFTCNMFKKYLTQSRTLYIIKINQELQVSTICIKIRASFVETRKCNYFALSKRAFKKNKAKYNVFFNNAKVNMKWQSSNNTILPLASNEMNFFVIDFVQFNRHLYSKNFQIFNFLKILNFHVEYYIIFRIFHFLSLRKNHFILDRTRHTTFDINSINLKKYSLFQQLEKNFLKILRKIARSRYDYTNHKL